MQKLLLAIATLAFLGAIYAWAGPRQRTPSAARWEYKQIATQHNWLLSPATDENGEFDAQANKKLVEGIDFSNSAFNKAFQKELHDLGAQGWELVSVTSSSGQGKNTVDVETTAYLKRPAR